MSFTDLVNTTLTNTILLPYRKPAEAIEGTTIDTSLNIAGTFKKSNTDNIPTSKDFKITIKSPGDVSACEMTYCRSISGLTVTRTYEERRAGGVYDYIAMVPNSYITYADISLSHVMTTDAFFLTWLLGGVDRGCGIYAQLEITVGKKGMSQKVIYTLNDALPTTWAFGGTFATSAASSPVVVMDSVTIAYGSMDVRVY